MVRGTTRQVLVVKGPDAKLFEQAIFIVKNEAFTQEGVTPQQVLGEACRIARGYVSGEQPRKKTWRKMPRWLWLAGAAAAAVGTWALLFCL